MAWEMAWLRKTRWGVYPRCFDILDAYAEIAPFRQRGCLFLYVGLGTWLGKWFGADMDGMWRRGELVLEDMTAVTGLRPGEIADKLRQFVSVKLRHWSPLDFKQAKALVYDQSFWPLAAHITFALQPSAIARQEFATTIAGSIDMERAHVADLGCGPGIILCEILKKKPLWTGQGLDISRPAIEYATCLAAHKNLDGRARFLTGDLAKLPYPNSSFDFVIASEVLEHVPDISQALREIARVLKPEAKAVVTVPLHSRNTLHVHALNGQHVFSLLNNGVGLTVRHFETRWYPGFGDDWRHGFLVAEARSDGTTHVVGS